MSIEPDNKQKRECEQVIELLQSLISKSPKNPGYRMRLLTLLHAHRRRYEFVVEAHKYKENCDLTFDTNWELICEMGREIDPGNEFFGKAGGRRPPPPEASNAPPGLSGQPAPQGVNDGTDRRAPESASSAGEDGPHEGSGREGFLAKRLEDRQKNYSTWFNEERRKHQQRQTSRRVEDPKKP